MASGVLYFFEVTLKLAAKEGPRSDGPRAAVLELVCRFRASGDIHRGRCRYESAMAQKKEQFDQRRGPGESVLCQESPGARAPGEFRQTFSPFRSKPNPHGSIHGAIGEDMGAVPRSARDPIFWLHHANIDRLWAVWTNMGDGQRTLPAIQNWAKQDWKFDAAGTMKLSAGGLTSSEADLKYRYDITVPIIPPGHPGDGPGHHCRRRSCSNTAAEP